MRVVGWGRGSPDHCGAFPRLCAPAHFVGIAFQSRRLDPCLLGLLFARGESASNVRTPRFPSFTVFVILKTTRWNIVGKVNVARVALAVLSVYVGAGDLADFD